jgi:hypothetical protein
MSISLNKGFALITGASPGIGAVYADRLAKRGQCLSQCAGNSGDLFDGESARRDQAIERPPLDQHHCEEVNAVGFFHGVNRDDMWMIERGDGASLALKASQAFGIAGHVWRQDLERHVAAKLGVRGAILLSHSSSADRGFDPVMSKRAADQIKRPEAWRL